MKTSNLDVSRWFKSLPAFDFAGAICGLVLAASGISIYLYFSESVEVSDLQTKLNANVQNILSRTDLALIDLNWKEVTEPVLEERLNRIVRFQDGLNEAFVTEIANGGPIAFNTRSSEGLVFDGERVDVKSLTWRPVRTKTFGILDWAQDPAGAEFVWLRRPLINDYDTVGYAGLKLNFRKILDGISRDLGENARIKVGGLLCLVDSELIDVGQSACFLSARDFAVYRGHQMQNIFISILLVCAGAGYFSFFYFRRNIIEPRLWLTILSRAAVRETTRVEDQVLSQIQERSPLYSSLIDAIKKAQNIKVYSQVAHDLASPLTALAIVAERLRRTENEELTLIQQSVARIEGICKDVLSQKTKGIYEHPLVEVVDVVEAVVREKAIIHAQHPIEIHSSLDRFTKVKIRETDFARVLSNILNNAIEASPHNEVIYVQLLQQGGKIAVIVKDRGKGIAPSMLQKLGFERVSMGKGTFGDRGFGLGTLHAATVLQRYGGRITWTSKQDQGASVTMLLPKENT